MRWKKKKNTSTHVTAGTGMTVAGYDVLIAHAVEEEEEHKHPRHGRYRGDGCRVCCVDSACSLEFVEVVRFGAVGTLM
jgi:hypothetical protein